MSSGKTHVYVFWLVYTAVVILLFHLGQLTIESLPAIFLGALVGTLGAIFPDVDARASKIRIRLQILLLVALTAFFGLFCYTGDLWWAAGVLLSIFCLFVITTAKHRGFFHSLRLLTISSVAIFITFYLLNLSPLLVTMAWALGFFTHLLLDKTLKF